MNNNKTVLKVLEDSIHSMHCDEKFLISSPKHRRRYYELGDAAINMMLEIDDERNE